MPTKAIIQSIEAREILDSRGNPTVESVVILTNGIRAKAAVPSGASTGSHEAVELRDDNPKRYNGKGVTKAVSHVHTVIAKKFKNKEIISLDYFDKEMIALDGTDNKAKLGANAILSVSMALARGHARHLKMPLYAYIRKRFFPYHSKWIMPKCMMNILNGGSHANWSTDIQEYMIIPLQAKTPDQIRAGAEVYQKLKILLKEKKLSTLVGDEGGFAPAVTSNEMPFQLIRQAIKNSGYREKKDIVFAIDVAATEFYKHKKYWLTRDRKKNTSDNMIAWYSAWTKKYPLVSIEDGLSEDDWEGWQVLTKKLKNTTLVGDDLFVTNVTRLQRGVALGIGNAIIIKPNQIGTVTESVETIRHAQEHGYKVVVSHRSGETCDDFIADLAVGSGADYLKAGAPARSERLAKYNRLVTIYNNIFSTRSWQA